MTIRPNAVAATERHKDIPTPQEIRTDLLRWAYVFMRRPRGSLDHEDLIQEGLLVAMGRLPFYQPKQIEASFMGWCRKAILNRWVDCIREQSIGPKNGDARFRQVGLEEVYGEGWQERLAVRDEPYQEERPSVDAKKAAQLKAAIQKQIAEPCTFGVYRGKKRPTYQVNLRLLKKQIYLGSFQSLSAADAAKKAALRDLLFMLDEY